MIITGLTVCKQPSLKRHDRAPNCVFQPQRSSSRTKGSQRKQPRKFTSLFSPWLRWWRVRMVWAPTGSSEPGCRLPDGTANVLLLLWSASRMPGPPFGALWWCGDRSFFPPFFSSACLALLPRFSPSPPDNGDLGLLFSTLPMLPSSQFAWASSNIFVNSRKHRRKASTSSASANNATG